MKSVPYGPGAAKPRSKNATMALLDRFADAELFMSPENIAYATCRVGDHIETWRVASRDFEALLRTSGDGRSLPGSQTIANVKAHLEARALRNSARTPVFRRLGWTSTAVYLDLCNARWQAVEITGNKSQVIDNPPVRFVRSATMGELPAPEPGGMIEQLRNHINVQADDEFMLCAAWLVATFMPGGPYPVLSVNGEQGSAKSTLVRILRTLVDPSSCPLRALPRDERDLAIAAHNTRILAFDNLSGLPSYLADALCRLAGGGGYATRALHTDRDETVFAGACPVVLNGIPDLTDRPDLADRIMSLKLGAIDDQYRKTEREIYAAFEREHAVILGSLCDAVVRALSRRDSVTAHGRARMADFVEWIAAAEPALGWTAGAFAKAYNRNRADTAGDIADSDPIAVAIGELLSDRTEWRGGATALLAELDNRASPNVRRSNAWPETAQALGARLRRLAPALRKRGIAFHNERNTSPDRSRITVLERIATRTMGCGTE